MLVMDSFDLNKQEAILNSSENNLVRVEQGEVSAERQLTISDRGYEKLTQPAIDSEIIKRPNQPSQVKSVSNSGAVRQSISVAGRFKNLEADNRDIIESSWVDGVKKTIESTKNHPSLRDDQIMEIREIYQQKRKNT